MTFPQPSAAPLLCGQEVGTPGTNRVIPQTIRRPVSNLDVRSHVWVVGRYLQFVREPCDGEFNHNMPRAKPERENCSDRDYDERETKAELDSSTFHAIVGSVQTDNDRSQPAGAADATTTLQPYPRSAAPLCYPALASSHLVASSANLQSGIPIAH